MAAPVLDSAYGGAGYYFTLGGRSCGASVFNHYECVAFYRSHAVNELGPNKALHLDVTKMIAIQEARITPRAIHNPRSWQQRLGLIMHYPHSEEEVKQYIEKQVSRALKIFSMSLDAVILRCRLVKWKMVCSFESIIIMKLILFIKLFHVKQYLQVFNWSYRSRRRSVFSS